MSARANGKRLASPQSVNSAVKAICDVMRRSNCAGALQYVPELTWILFLRILDEHETKEAEHAEALGVEFHPSLEAPYRWRDWAAPEGPKRKELQDGKLGDMFAFVNGELLPYLKKLKSQAGAAPRQKVISEIMSGVERTRIDTERNFLDVIDKVHEISSEAVDPTHVFTLSQVYEGLLLKMGEKGNDGGQFFTPREVIRAIVRAVKPRVGETVYDPACGTGGFLAQSYEFMRDGLGPTATANHIETLKRRTFFGREKENLIYPIGLANLILHGVDQPNLWHGNTLTGQETYGGLFEGAPALFDVVMMNPPFGGKEGKEAQTRFVYKTSVTQVLFLQHVIDSLKPKGRCGMVIDEGVLFRTNETAFVQTKRKLLDDCDLWCILSLPPGVFVSAGAGVKTNLLFFTRGGPTEKIWYYDLADIKVGKKTPLTIDRFDDFFRLIPSRGDSDRSWTVTRAEIEAKGYDLKAVNPNAKSDEDKRTPEELLEIINKKGIEVAEAVGTLRGLLRNHDSQRMSTLEHAIALAAKAHEGQPDKAGAPYILHPLRVMLRVSTSEERITAVLHDVVEDCGWPLDRLREEGFSESVIQAVDAVTKREGEDYFAFVRRAAANPIGRKVKLADLRDNCDLSRIAEPTEGDRERTRKYVKAIALIEELERGSEE